MRQVFLTKLIPFNQLSSKIKSDKVLLEVEIVEDIQLEEGYTILEELVEFCASSPDDGNFFTLLTLQFEISPLFPNKNASSLK